VQVRDEHEAAQLRQQEFRQNLPWRTAPFTKSTLVAEEAVPPLLQLPSKHDGHSHTAHRVQHHLHHHRQQDEEEAASISGAVDPSASIQVQELQKLLVEVLKEVAVATDPTQRRIAESMLSQVRATILALKGAEWVDELDGSSEWEEHIAETAAYEEHGGEQQTAEEAEEVEAVADTENRQHHRDTERRERDQDFYAAGTMADSQAREQMNARAGAMDSWLTEQQHQARMHSPKLQSRSPPQLHLRQATRHRPVVSTAWVQRPQDQYPQPPPNDQVRQQLVVRSSGTC
jgi:hypothetical protein